VVQVTTHSCHIRYVHQGYQTIKIFNTNISITIIKESSILFFYIIEILLHDVDERQVFFILISYRNCINKSSNKFYARILGSIIA
jgi:hypothetical protein